VEYASVYVGGRVFKYIFEKICGRNSGYTGKIIASGLKKHGNNGNVMHTDKEEAFKKNVIL